MLKAGLRFPLSSLHRELLKYLGLSINQVSPVRLNLINHLVGFILYKFACILAISNPVFRWESCKGGVWESVKNCSSLCKEAGTRGWISQVACGYKLPECCTHAKHARNWSVALAVALQDKIPRLARPFACDLTQSWGQVARTPYLGKYEFSHSFSPYYIYTLIPTI